MPLFTIIILALIQGITEFLPISSSGHLVLAQDFLGGPETLDKWDSHVLLNVAVHVGTLFSVLLYFRKDVLLALHGLVDCGKRDFKSQGARLNIHVIVASIPVIIAGVILHALEPSWLLMVEIVAWTTLIFGILLWVADRLPQQDKTLENMTVKDAILIGLAQSLALIPGTSRSGVTMTASRFLGYSRTESARFSLLLAIVAITGAGLLLGKDLVEMGDVDLTYDVFLAAFLAFLSALAAIHLMMKWLERSTFTPFVIYRIVLGGALLIYLYF